MEKLKRNERARIRKGMRAHFSSLVARAELPQEYAEASEETRAYAAEYKEYLVEQLRPHEPG